MERWKSGVSIATLERHESALLGFVFTCAIGHRSRDDDQRSGATIPRVFLTTATISRPRVRGEKGASRRPPPSAGRIEAGKTLFRRSRHVQADISRRQGQHTASLDRVLPQGDGRHQQYFNRARRRNSTRLDLGAITNRRGGANKISQLRLYVANGFTSARPYLARGHDIDDLRDETCRFFSTA